MTTEPQRGDACADTGEPMHWNEAAGKTTHPGKCVMSRDHRHLELTIHPPAPYMPGVLATWNEFDAWKQERAAERDAWVGKLFPEAELAAEYWRAKAAGTQRLTWPNGVPTFEDEADIIERFAARQHAASSGYQ
jgi:hypothetical protein